MVFQLAYASTAVRPFAPEALVDLVDQARTNNAEHGLTGVLLYRRQRFLQLLEGEERAVLRLYAAIVADDRHEGVATLMRGRRIRRQFPTWTMAFRDLVVEPISEPGYTSLFEDAVDRMQGAVDELVPRLRPSGPTGRPVVRVSHGLGLVAS